MSPSFRKSLRWLANIAAVVALIWLWPVADRFVDAYPITLPIMMAVMLAVMLAVTTNRLSASGVGELPAKELIARGLRSAPRHFSRALVMVVALLVVKVILIVLA